MKNKTKNFEFILSMKGSFAIYIYTQNSVIRSYFFLVEDLVEDLVEVPRPWEWAEGDGFVVLETPLTGVSATDLVELAREADLSKARIFSKAFFSSVSAWMALSSSLWARSSVSLQKKKIK